MSESSSSVSLMGYLCTRPCLCKAINHQNKTKQNKTKQKQTKKPLKEEKKERKKKKRDEDEEQQHCMMS